ncbi:MULTISPECIES: exonuclease domain-containing protein [Paenibacillus]|uniref:Subunit epsilon of DNA polymerase III n=1 Tax=Paenibacillus naphthalenovorans TaxID=162209 RepID=A0A0U2W0W7_9BACL|nr:MULTISPECIES: exonuclease domain-containing protein [Paenibacillus]ALS21021.1 subunit epsilon of DNA polymerase III [Paenibacillus naphthalenovorans]GCL71056.1 DNA polymerase III subunit epsilon [Paenibacillus naphthalenovorans]SDI61768.1 DNA polymerase-3 subunit epsilon [Paenibacillus naphthalenovorans]
MKDMKPAGRMWHLYKTGGFTSALTSMFDVQSAQQMAFIRSIMKEQRKNSLYDIPLHSVELVVFDLETTGFSPYNGDEIIAFGAVSVNGSQIAESQTFYSLVHPKRSIPDEIEKLTGITNEMVAEAPDLLHALRGFLEFVQRKVLVAHGSGHDKHFLNSALWKTSRVSLSHRLLDTMMIAKWLNPRLKAYDLDTLLDLYGVEVTKRHHALEDALMTARLWSKLMLEVQARDIQTLGDLYTQLSYH